MVQGAAAASRPGVNHTLLVHLWGKRSRVCCHFAELAHCCDLFLIVALEVFLYVLGLRQPPLPVPPVPLAPGSAGCCGDKQGGAITTHSPKYYLSRLVQLY